MARDLALAIEISNPSSEGGDLGGPGVALGRRVAGGITVEGVERLAPERRHDDDLLPAIDRLFRRCGRGPRDIGLVGVSIGPGGFTSLRIAIAAAKMICEATGSVCVGVPSAEVVARSVTGRAGPFAVALASKADTAYVTLFSPSGRAEGPGRLAGAGDLEGLGVRLLVADRFLPGPMRERAGELGIEVCPPVFDPAACLACAVEGSPIDALALAPIYPRPPEALVKWRQLHPEAGAR